MKGGYPLLRELSAQILEHNDGFDGWPIGPRMRETVNGVLPWLRGPLRRPDRGSHLLRVVAMIFVAKVMVAQRDHDGQRDGVHFACAQCIGLAAQREVKLTRFRGHPILMDEGVRYAYTEASVPGGVPPTDGPTGPSGAHAVAARA